MKVPFRVSLGGLIAWTEAHVELAALGTGGIYLLVMGWLCILYPRNAVQFEGKAVGPAELNSAIHAAAEELRRAYDQPTAVTNRSARFSDLRKLHEAGVLATLDAAPSKPTLRQAAPFGPVLEVPGSAAGEQLPALVGVVLPLPPTQPVVRTGRSLVSSQTIRVAPESGVRVEIAGGETERAWVSIAAYFDQKGQQAELIRAGYSAARQNVYVAGVDVQRRERLADGEWSEWRDVTRSAAMPQVDLAEPRFDDVSGAVTNRVEVEAGFQLVKASQATLVQPPFPPVSAGDTWRIPPLAGFDEVKPVVIGDGPKAGPRNPHSPGQPSGIPETRGPIHNNPPVQPPTSSAQGGQAKQEARRRAVEDLKAARAAAGEKNWPQAIAAAEAVLSNEEATKSDKDGARKIRAAAEDELGPGKSAAQSTIPEGGFGGLVREPGGGRAAVWFHDDRVESGKTYCYRMRVRLWNRYVGQIKLVRDAEDARKSTIAGEWSVASEPVTVVPSTYFLAKAAKPGGGAALDVWKWRKGKWVKQGFEVAVGDVIGSPRKVSLEDSVDSKEKAEVDFSTGAVVLDIRPSEAVKVRVAGRNGAFTERDQNSLVLVYLDPSDGQVKERVSALDRYDPMRKVLEGEGG